MPTIRVTCARCAGVFIMVGAAAALAVLEDAVEARRVLVIGERVSDNALARMLARMPRLASLDVCVLNSATAVRPTSAFLVGASLPELRAAWCVNARAGAGFGTALAAAAPGLRALTLQECGLDADDAAAIAALPELEVLQLADDGMDRLLPTLAAAPVLRGLRVADCDARDADLAPLAGHPRLEWLGLRGTRVTDAVCAILETLPALTTVDLVATDVSDEVVAALRAARPSLRVRR
jgi:hypothetical protein